MFFLLAIIAVFVATSVYFFMQNEKLKSVLLAQRRESSDMRKENKVLVDSMTLVASSFELTAKHRLKLVKDNAKKGNQKQLMQQCELISPLINNYNVIFRACVKGQGRLKKVTKKCFDSHNSSDYNKFIRLIMHEEKQVKRFWASDNLQGFIALAEALLLVIEEYDESVISVSQVQAKQEYFNKAVSRR